MEYKVGDYIITNWFAETVKILSVEEEGVIVLTPFFVTYENGDVAFRQCEIEFNDIVNFSTKATFLQDAKNNFTEYQNDINQRLTKMQNLIISSEVID